MEEAMTEHESPKTAEDEESEKARKKEIGYEKVSGERNLADLLTKHLGNDRMEGLVARLELEYQEGRAETAPELARELGLLEGRKKNKKLNPDKGVD